MSHGSPDALAAAPIKTGPREALQLGFDSARASQNILRLLESSHGSGSLFGDTLCTVWHPSGLRWSHGSNGWECSSYDDMRSTSSLPSPSSAATPRLEWLNFSDDRTALAKIQGVDGLKRYVSMLRLDPDAKNRHAMHANDGWCIVREVQSSANQKQDCSLIGSITEVLEKYLSIEHGGGNDDKARAQELFAPDASLISVGTAPLEEEPTDWSSPSGSLLNISLDTYLDGVKSQTPHSSKAKACDLIVSLDTMPSAAAATVHVGNGAQTTVFVDHLLLGYHENMNMWKILSKTFSPRPYPV